MAQTKIVIDGTTVIDKNIGDWTKDVPELKNYLQPDSKPQPYMQAVLVVMASAAIRGQPFAAEIVTRDGGWSLEVDTP